MERISLALVIFATVAIGVGGQIWVSWLEHKRRLRVMDLLAAEMAAGREPSPQLYAELAAREQSSKRGTLVLQGLFFAALSAGFWYGWLQSSAHRSAAFLVIAATFTATAIGSLGFAWLQRSGSGDG